MTLVNENYLKLQGSYLFAEIARRVSAFKKENPSADVISLGIGDVTQPLAPVVIEALHKAVEEMADAKTFRGYGPEQGYAFLREAIVNTIYAPRKAQIESDEIFVSDGAKSDCGNIQEIFGNDNIIAITDPVYPVYLDTNVMAGRTGLYNEAAGIFDNVVYMPCTAENNFIPDFPKKHVDIIYICCPNNPTGTTLSRKQLSAWVKYAKENDSVILYDAAYSYYITQEDVPRTIYEIDGARDVAVEFRSFSKTAGFTGMRCGYTVIPKTVFGHTKSGMKQALNPMWNRRHTTKFNGTAYIVQRAAEAVLSNEGQKQIMQTIDYYMNNAKTICRGLDAVGIKYFGGINAPYIWLKAPNSMKSWEFFDKLLNEANIVGTPGAGFGPSGEGYFRLTAFGDRESTIKAVERIKTKLKL
ncbi:LL-diaminopimelate aminotransferase [Pectinatus haikarae]|uniref:LL-diaminopimelate aminotransferase n=1 Tax=Pectinatus haikarae TaxID=349096 RepID=A0ABT9YAL2_9FIRM|nr:LL-diaminopimelate aminotransferase [Pectinatus haikarae]MDQ0204874.1 LL-diaminopimelate aminotransferase [Pectinatus haikarae]